VGNISKSWKLLKDTLLDAPRLTIWREGKNSYSGHKNILIRRRSEQNNRSETFTFECKRKVNSNTWGTNWNWSQLTKQKKGKEINENTVTNGINNVVYKMCYEEKELKQRVSGYLIDAFACRTKENWFSS